MAEIITAPAPAGVQSTFDNPLGPQPAQTKVGDKFRQELDKLTKGVKPEEPKHEEPKPSEAPEATTEKPVAEPDIKPAQKAASPLDSILETQPKETPPVEEPDVLKELENVKNPVAEDWQKLKGIAKTYKGELKTLREKVQTLETAPKAQPTEIADLVKQRDELQTKFQQQEERLKAINYQYSDEYQGLLKDRENLVHKISTRVKSYGGDANALVEALSLPEGKVKTTQIKEALSELDPDDKPRIHALIEAYETHNEKIEDATKNSAPKWDELVSSREAQLAEQSQAAIKQLETQYGKIVETIPAASVTLRQVPEDVPGGKEWNAEVKSAIDRGLSVLKPNGADFNQSVEIAVKGARYDTLEKRYLELHKEYSAAKKQLAEYDGSGPDFKGTPKPASTVEKKPGVKFREALAMAHGAGVGEV